MRRAIVAVIVAASLVVIARADMSARWELHADFDDRRIPGAFANCTFKQEAERLSGRCEDATLIGEIKKETVTWRLTTRTHDIVIFTGMLDDDDTVILGRFSYPGRGGGSFLAIKR